MTDVGLAREHNEDNILVRPDIGLWAVADGMGGYGGGDVASGAVVAALKTVSPTRLRRALARRIRGEDRRRQLRPARMARARDGAILGTTLVALMIHGTHFACVWCGDSRVYLRRDGALAQVSRDHSEVQELIDRGVLAQGGGEDLAAPQRGDARAGRDG